VRSHRGSGRLRSVGALAKLAAIGSAVLSINGWENAKS